MNVSRWNHFKVESFIVKKKIKEKNEKPENKQCRYVWDEIHLVSLRYCHFLVLVVWFTAILHFLLFSLVEFYSNRNSFFFCYFFDKRFYCCCFFSIRADIKQCRASFAFLVLYVYLFLIVSCAFHYFVNKPKNYNVLFVAESHFFLVARQHKTAYMKWKDSFTIFIFCRIGIQPMWAWHSRHNKESVSILV